MFKPISFTIQLAIAVVIAAVTLYNSLGMQ